MPRLKIQYQGDSKTKKDSNEEIRDVSWCRSVIKKQIRQLAAGEPGMPD